MSAHSAPSLTLNDITISFGGPALVENAHLSVHAGDRICLVGRNGAGKSSLLKVMAGLTLPDDGERIVPPNTRITYLAQTPSLRDWPTALDAVKSGLTPEQSDLEYLADSYLRELNVAPERPTITMSGGEERKVALAKALIGDPHVLLLDEPTNHLDLPSIEWLERTLARLNGAVVLISHDRTLLERCTQRTLWVERGKLRQTQQGFERFETWREEVYHEEDLQRQRLDKLLAQETQWLREGISARRTRNQGRLRRLYQLREERASQRKRVGRAGLTIESGERSGKVVIQAKGISKSFEGRLIFAPLDLRIMRGDRIGLIGPNGAGKSTLIKVLCGDLPPDEGSVELGTKLKTVYIDQNRSLDPDATLAEILCVPGSDRVMVHGQPKHVAGYLQDFLFEGKDSRRRVKSLSGGERARLLFAQQFAESANLLILDEPTNDLDLETLELLQDILGEYEGTVLMVSHDRNFLDHVVTSTLAFEEHGQVIEYAGGYHDMLAQRAERSMSTQTKPTEKKPPVKRAKQKLSYKEERALESAQADIERLSSSLATLEEQLADSTFFERDPAGFQATIKEIEAQRNLLEAAEEEWLSLETLREELQGG